MAQNYDIHIQTLPEADQRKTFKFMSFGFESTLGVKGFQMLINMWLKCFLTPRGSAPINLKYGTDFTKLIGSNVSPLDARDVVQLAVDDCNRQLTAIQAIDTTLTATERLASCNLVQFVVDNSAPGFTATVEIKNQANERLVLNLPDLATV
jgi:hypothetical protein